MRRLITLISAGRNRTIVIRRELPLTRDADWVRRPDRLKDRRILLSVPSRPEPRPASAMSWLQPHLLNLADRLARSAGTQNLPNLLGRHLVWLHAFRHIDHLHPAVSAQPSSYFGSSSTPCGIPIQHEDHPLELLQQDALLRRIQSRSHQGDHRTGTGLTQPQAVEKSFDHHHDRFGGCGGAMKIKQDLRFGEAGREAVPRLAAIHGPAPIGDQFSPLTMVWDHQPSVEDSRPRVS